MAVQTKGFCKYCGNEYTKAGMLRHLSACKKEKLDCWRKTIKEDVDILK